MLHRDVWVNAQITRLSNLGRYSAGAGLGRRAYIFALFPREYLSNSSDSQRQINTGEEDSAYNEDTLSFEVNEKDKSDGTD